MSFWDRLVRAVKGTQDLRVLMVGPMGAGKTAVLYKLKLGEVVTTIPTMGFNVESLELPGTRCTACVWDVGGNDRIRVLFRHYLANTQGLIYVANLKPSELPFGYDLDADARDAQHKRMGIATCDSPEFLWSLLRDEPEIAGIPVCVIGTHSDAPDALSDDEVIARLRLAGVTDRPWHVTRMSVPHDPTASNGAWEALRWIHAIAFPDGTQRHWGFRTFTFGDDDLPPVLRAEPFASLVRGYCVVHTERGWYPTPPNAKAAVATTAAPAKSSAPAVPAVLTAALRRVSHLSDALFRDKFEAACAAAAPRAFGDFQFVDLLRIIWIVLRVEGRQKGVKLLFDRLRKLTVGDAPAAANATAAAGATAASSATASSASGAVGWSFHCTRVYFWIQIVDFVRAHDVVADAAAAAAEAATNADAKHAAAAPSPLTPATPAARPTLAAPQYLPDATTAAAAAASGVVPAAADAATQCTTFLSFLERHPALFLTPELILDHYSPALLAKSGVDFALPDRKPMPSILPVGKKK